MSISGRCAFLALIIGLAGAPALAQGGPAGTWTDPPVRGAAGPPATVGAKPETASPSPAKPVEATAPERVMNAPEPVRRTARSRRQEIRRVASQADTPAARAPRRRALRNEAARQPPTRAHRTTIARRARPIVERRSYAERSSGPHYRYRIASRPIMTPYGYGDPDAVQPSAYEPYAGYGYATRRAGWGSLLGSERDRRIAEARAAGYLVMRAQTVALPDGTLVRRLRPLDADDPD